MRRRGMYDFGRVGGGRQAGRHDYQGHGKQVPAGVPSSLREPSTTSPGQSGATGGPESQDFSRVWAPLSARLGLFRSGLFQVQKLSSVTGF